MFPRTSEQVDSSQPWTALHYCSRSYDVARILGEVCWLLWRAFAASENGLRRGTAMRADGALHRHVHEANCDRFAPSDSIDTLGCERMTQPRVKQASSGSAQPDPACPPASCSPKVPPPRTAVHAAAAPFKYKVICQHRIYTAAYNLERLAPAPYPSHSRYHSIAHHTCRSSRPTSFTTKTTRVVTLSICTARLRTVTA